MKAPFIFCVSHQPPLIPEHLYDYAIGLGRYRPHRGAHISTIDAFWDSMRVVSYQAAGTHSVARAIDNLEELPALTGLFTYRRFITKTGAALRRNPSREPRHTISPTESQNIRVEDVHPWDGHQFLVSTPVEFPTTVVDQYISSHQSLDLYEYLSIAVEVGVLTMEEVQDLSRSRIFVPGGCELGIFPTEWLHSTLYKLIAVGREFVTRNYYRILTYDRLQARALGFLAERLGSYYLLKELRARYPVQIPEKVFGDMFLVIPEGMEYQPARAER